MIRYRTGSALDRGALAQKSWRFEIAWTSATLVVFFGLFVWGADLFVRLYQPPPDALKIYVIGKQWMWKVEHPGRPARDQRPACPDRPPGPAADDAART